MGRPSKFDSAFKVKVALEALQEKETLLSLSKKYGVASSVISKWKEELLQNSQKAFEPDTSSARRIDRWIRFYNFERPHQGLDGAIPSATYNSVA